jgi:alkylation response protein AidB-like acyl-CoA dehydrogenase
VDARLTSEQLALRDSVAAMVRDHAAKTVQELGDTERISRLAGHMGEAGLLELRRDDGGLPRATGVEVALVAEQLAFGAAEASFVGPTLASDLARRAGACVSTTTTIALNERLTDAAAAQDLATAIALDARGATDALVLASDRAGFQLVTVPIGALTFPTDLTRPLGRVASHKATKPIGHIGADDIIAWRAFGRGVLAADLLGAMRAAHELTLEYAKERQQYGRPIGSFQAVQHLLADSLVRLEGAQSAAYYAAWAADAEPLETAREAALVAKAYCAAAAREVCEIAIQVHGGIGNTWDCMVHVHLRRVLQSIQPLGDEGRLLDDLAELRQGDGRGLSRQ